MRGAMRRIGLVPHTISGHRCASWEIECGATGIREPVQTYPDPCVEQYRIVLSGCVPQSLCRGASARRDVCAPSVRRRDRAFVAETVRTSAARRIGTTLCIVVRMSIMATGLFGRMGFVVAENLLPVCCCEL